MLCDKYKEALIETAASGAALPVAVREHMDACAHCSAALGAQQALFTLVDASLRSRTNVEVPSNFEHRVRAALHIQVSGGRRAYSPVFAFGSMGLSAALALAIVLIRNPNNSRKEMPPSSVVQVEVSASHPRAASGDRKELEIFSHQPRPSHVRALNTAQHPNVPARGYRGVEVLVPQGQEELLAKYLEGIAARKARVTLSAKLQHEPDMKPVEVTAIEISELAVKPLSDLSLN
jgi:hypothetical protein